jgi:hypothetical protein
MVPFQSCIDLLKFEPGLCGETYNDGNQVTDIKVESVKNEQEEEDPLLLTYQVRKRATNKVSCLSVCITLGTLYKYSEVICIGRWIKSKYSS